MLFVNASIAEKRLHKLNFYLLVFELLNYNLFHISTKTTAPPLILSCSRNYVQCKETIISLSIVYGLLVKSNSGLVHDRI